MEAKPWGVQVVSLVTCSSGSTNDRTVLILLRARPDWPPVNPRPDDPHLDPNDPHYDPHYDPNDPSSGHGGGNPSSGHGPKRTGDDRDPVFWYRLIGGIVVFIALFETVDRIVLRRNEDLLGWLTVPGTVIDYPVVQTPEDREFYLNHNFDRMPDSHGTLYADAACWLGDGNNLIVYGHHMSDGSMFQNLMKYQRADFCLENGEIVFSTRDCNRSFRPVAVLRVSEREARDFPYHTFTTLPDSAAYEDFFARCEPYADWMAEERPACPAMLLTLSTCEYSKPNGRLVVICACTGLETAPQP